MFTIYASFGIFFGVPTTYPGLNIQRLGSRHWIWLKYCGLVVYIKKYFKAKKIKMEKTQIYFSMQKYNLKKKSSKKETKSLKIL
jgi:hypothetical protein